MAYVQYNKIVTDVHHITVAFDKVNNELLLCTFEKGMACCLKQFRVPFIQLLWQQLCSCWKQLRCGFISATLVVQCTVCVTVSPQYSKVCVLVLQHISYLQPAYVLALQCCDGCLAKFTVIGITGIDVKQNQSAFDTQCYDQWLVLVLLQ